MVKSLMAVQNLKPSGHGGDLQAFCSAYGFSETGVLDLSTGISPWCWPVPDIPQSVWQKLPYGEFSSESQYPDLVEVASDYYRCDPKNLIPVSGSQAAIEILPLLASRKTGSESLVLLPEIGSGYQVLVPEIGYAEHAFNWSRKGCKVGKYSHLSDLQGQLEQSHAKYAVVINPNNPGTDQYMPEELLPVAGELGARGGFLIVDEAFADVRPDLSLASFTEEHALVVLRSVGKFFGLAGLRLGFAIASERLIAEIKSEIGLWSVNSVAHWLGTRMLSDSEWIDKQRLRLTEGSSRLYSYLQEKLPDLNWKRSANFVSGFGLDKQVTRLESSLAKSGILVRRFEGDPSIIRIGLTSDDGFKRLQLALESMEQNNEI